MNQQSTLGLEPPLQLTAIEVRERMPGGLTSPWLVVVLDENEEEIQIVLKLRDPGVPVGTGHFGSTSMACELLCSMLARAIGLNVPDYAVVQVTQAFGESIYESQTRELFRRNIGDNFGSVYQASFGPWHPNYQATSQEVLEQLEGTLTFDSTVINGDRTSQKPNLLYDGETILLIDHSLALPVHQWNDQTIQDSPLFHDSNIRQHCCFRSLKGKSHLYQDILDVWRTNINQSRFNYLKAILPPNWEYRSGDIEKIFKFLIEREQRFTEISQSLMRVMG